MTFDLAEHYLACHDELDIEAELLHWADFEQFGEDEARARDQTRQVLVGVLRTIDALKVEGTYGEVRQELRRARMPATDRAAPPPSIARKLELLDQALPKLHALLNSPDAEQKRRVETMMWRHGLNARPIMEWADIAVCLEEPAGRQGRPRVTPPWRPYAAALDTMRLEVAAGETVTAASRRAAEKHSSPGGTLESQAKKLFRHYAKRMKLRD